MPMVLIKHLKPNPAMPTVMAQQDQRPSEVRQMMDDNLIHHIPIVSGSKLVGIVSSTDFLRVMYNDIDMDWDDELLDRKYPTIWHLVSKKKNVELISINENDTLHEAAEKLMNGNFHSLPVVNGDNDVVGIVTSTDLIKHLYTPSRLFQRGWMSNGSETH